jgi:hypothetical protein
VPSSATSRTFQATLSPTGSYSFTSHCDFGSPGCRDPGYLVQWPYTQPSASPGGRMSLASGLLSAGACRLAAGAVWDPFADSLLNEYLDCADATGKVPPSIAFLEPSGQAGPPVAFHFATAYYEAKVAAASPSLALSSQQRFRRGAPLVSNLGEGRGGQGGALVSH